MTPFEVAKLRAAICGLTTHDMGGYECEWNCELYDEDGHSRDRCPNPEEHEHPFVSRTSVLILFDAAVGAVEPTEPEVVA